MCLTDQLFQSLHLVCLTMHFFKCLPAAQVSASTWSMGGAATFSQPPVFSYLNQSSPSLHYASMPSPPLLQQGPTQAYHRALAAASQPYPSWHSLPSTPQQARAAASGPPRATTLRQPPASAPGCPPAAALRQLPATAPEQVPTTGPLHPSGAASELPHVSASQALLAQSHLLQQSASAASPHLPPASGTMDLGQHARTHMQAKLAQQQAIPATTQMPEAAAVSQAVEVSEAASAAALQADQDAGQPQLPAQPADSASSQKFSIAKPVSSAAATRETIRAFQPPLPLGLPPALVSIPEQGNATTGATALVRPQAGQQPQHLYDRPLVPKLQPRAVTLARQTSHAGSAEPQLQTPAPVSKQLNAQPDIPSPALTSTGEAPEQLPQPAMLASVQQHDDKPSSEQFAAEQPADAHAQELAQLLLLKHRELSQKPLQKLPQAYQQLQGRCQEQPQGLLQAQPPEHPLTQPHGQLQLSPQAQCQVGGKQPAAGAAGCSAPVMPAFAVAGRQGSLKAEADAELLHSNSSQSAVQLSPLNMGTSPSVQNISQVPDHKGQVATVSVFDIMHSCLSSTVKDTGSDFLLDCCSDVIHSFQRLAW